MTIAPQPPTPADASGSAGDDTTALRLAAIVEIKPCDADPDRVQQVFWNLLSNAVKFTPRRGRITARLRREPGAVASGSRSSVTSPSCTAAFVTARSEGLGQGS